MDFGTNLLEWFQSNAKALVLVAVIFIGLYLAFKREFSKLIGFLIIGVIAVLFVFNTEAVVNIMLELGNKVIGA